MPTQQKPPADDLPPDLPPDDLPPDHWDDPEVEPDEPAEPSDLDYEDVPCTDDGDDDRRWDVFIPDDDEFDPEPDRGDFWIENRNSVSAFRTEVARCTR